MRGSVALVLFTVLLAAACGRRAGPGAGASPGAGPPDERRLDVYEAVIRATASTEGWYGAIYVRERICREASGGEGGERRCPDTFSPEEQSALVERLSDLPRVSFVADGGTVVRDDSTVRHGGALVTVGPIEEEGDRVEVQTAAYCGNLCGHWMTWVVEQTAAGWKVTGTTGPVAIS